MNPALLSRHTHVGLGSLRLGLGTFGTLTLLVAFCRVPSSRAETSSVSGATAITSVPCQIRSAGTYYLASDFTLSTDAAYGISITASKVTLGFTGHTLAQTFGSGTSTIGVYVGANNVTVRNGTISSCLEGLDLYGNNGCLEDLFIAASTYHGMVVSGSGLVVRRCRINNTGGEQVSNLAPYANGIFAPNCSYLMVTDCDIVNVFAGSGYIAACLTLASCANAMIVNNRLSGSFKDLEGVYSTGKYRDNLCSADLQVPYSFLYQTLVDAGNNQ